MGCADRVRRRRVRGAGAGEGTDARRRQLVHQHGRVHLGGRRGKGHQVHYWLQPRLDARRPGARLGRGMLQQPGLLRPLGRRRANQEGHERLGRQPERRVSLCRRRRGHARVLGGRQRQRLLAAARQGPCRPGHRGHVQLPRRRTHPEPRNQGDRGRVHPHRRRQDAEGHQGRAKGSSSRWAGSNSTRT